MSFPYFKYLGSQRKTDKEQLVLFLERTKKSILGFIFN